MPADNERDELAQLLDNSIDRVVDPEQIADCILSSSWLAGKLKQARADALREAVEVRALWQSEARMNGDVCLFGTRIPADLVADYIADLRESYPDITPTHIAAVWQWDALGRPDLPYEVSAPPAH